LVATTPDTPEELWDADLTGPVALAVGAEAIGLSPEVLDASAERVGVPMYGRVDSLNASVTAGIVLYEAVRQRRHS
ncbi:MAG TPA: TrmH family RNA methyltransferase, partial [Acidimicrobiia bacterium]|nr:TrmH family RNA methyltransferase [Acidimicrobiia bacterium]